MTLYSRNGAYPTPLPAQATDETGRVWTHLDLPENSTGRETCGFVEVADPPSYDPQTEVLGWEEGEWVVSAAPPPPAPTPTELAAYAMQKRWEAEQAGLLFDGNPIPTHDKGQFYISGAYQAALADAGLTKRWQVGNDPIAFVTWSNEQLRALGLALDTLIQSTFDKLDEVAADIVSDDITTLAEIDTAFAGINRVFTSGV